MTGWRVGFAVGNAQLVAGSARSRPTSTPAPSRPCSAPAIAALDGDQALRRASSAQIYRERRDVLCGGLAAAGFDVLTPAGDASTR